MQACYCGMVSAIKENSAQSSAITLWGQNLKLKGCYCFLKKYIYGGVEHDKVPERPFASEVTCCCCTLCLIVTHIIPLDMSPTGTCRQERCVRLHRDKLSNRGRSVGREKGSYAYMLGKMTPAIELCKIIGHLTGRQVTCGEPMPEDKWHFLKTVL